MGGDQFLILIRPSLTIHSYGVMTRFSEKNRQCFG